MGVGCVSVGIHMVNLQSRFSLAIYVQNVSLVSRITQYRYSIASWSIWYMYDMIWFHLHEISTWRPNYIVQYESKKNRIKYTKINQKTKDIKIQLTFQWCMNDEL